MVFIEIMKKITLVLGILIGAAFILTQFRYAPATLQESLNNSRETAITQAIQRVSPAVVGVNVTKIQRYSNNPFSDPFFEYFFGPSYREVPSVGSGFIISTDGFIYTNAHVVNGAREIIITTPGGEQHEAEIIGIDSRTDLALLKIDVENMPAVELGDSRGVIIGEWVVALGNPFGLFDVSYQPTATVGIISGKDMDFGRQEDKIYQDMLQTDASINSGNSGGPLVNANGQVIGINTFIFTGGGYSRGSVGVGFAIPINRVKRIMAELREEGEIEWYWDTGISVQEIDRDLARALNLPIQGGLIVKSVQRRSAAARAGIQVGDVILEAEGQILRNEQDIFDIVEDRYLHVGDTLNLVIWREGERREIQLTLESGA